MKQVTLQEERLRELLDRMGESRVGVLGDVCLDMYWYADMKRSQLSRETPHYPLPVVEERFSPGACGNVIQNIAALRVGKLLPVSVIGDDWRGMLLSRCFRERKVDDSFLITSGKRITPCYCKPIRMGISQVRYEDPRLDFENFETLPEELENELIKNLEKVSGQVDALAVSDQFFYGVVTERVRAKLSELGRNGLTVVVDSRDRIRLYQDVMIKPNEVESAAAVGKNASELEVTPENYEEIALELSRQSGWPAIVTLGEKGALWCDGKEAVYAPSRKAAPPVDIVGAGDTFLSAFCASVAAGASGGEAAALANLASGVTVKKIGTTGTASPEEILKLYKENEQSWQ